MRKHKIILTPVKELGCDGEKINLTHYGELCKIISNKKKLLNDDKKYYKCLFGHEIEISHEEYDKYRCIGINVYIR